MKLIMQHAFREARKFAKFTSQRARRRPDDRIAGVATRAAPATASIDRRLRLN
jgi:hypothetical protein